MQPRAKSKCGRRPTLVEEQEDPFMFAYLTFNRRGRCNVLTDTTKEQAQNRLEIYGKEERLNIYGTFLR